MSNKLTTKHNTGVLPALGVATLLLTVIAIIWAGRSGYLSNASVQPVVQANAQYTNRILGFVDHRDGSVEVIDKADNGTVRIYQTGEGSFLRGIMRSLTRERRANGIGMEQPFELRAEAGNRLLLIDQATGTTLLLNAFGKENVAGFESLLDAPVITDT